LCHEAENIDVLVTVGQLAGYIAAAAIEHGASAVVACESHEAAKAALKRQLEPGDTILVKGSRGMKMEKVLEMFD
jgi:UDP-N-acetylmuramyl pentapeptide synthase